MSELLECGHVPSKHEEFSTGYGEDADGKRYCYECCGTRDRASMIEDGKATLYLTRKGDGEYMIGNWPDSLKFSIHHVRIGRHNIARVRYDVWFAGPDGKPWHGVQYGDNTQICHASRIKG